MGILALDLGKYKSGLAARSLSPRSTHLQFNPLSYALCLTTCLSPSCRWPERTTGLCLIRWDTISRRSSRN